MKKMLSVLLSTLIYTLSFSQEANEKEQDTIHKKIVEIDEVIVVGNSKKDPILTTVNNYYEQEVIQPKNVAGLFENINGFSTIKRGNYAIDPTFRAAQYEQLNVMYDGVVKAVHACANRMDPITTHVVPEEISRIEIIKGPYSVRYGPTFGGIVNMVTKNPDLNEMGFHGKLSGGYETNGNSYVTMLQLQQITEKYDLVGNFGYRNFGNYEDGNGFEVPSSFTSTDYGIKAGYTISDLQRIKLHWRQSFGRDVLHAGLPMDTDFDNSSILSMYYWILFPEGMVNKIKVNAYYSYVDHLMHNFNRPSFMKMEASSPVESTTMGGKVELEWKPFKDFGFFSGLDGNHIARDGVRNRLVKLNMDGDPLPIPMEFVDKIWQDSYITDIGVFNEVRWYVNNKTTINAGIRYDRITTDIKDPEDDFTEMYDLKKRNEDNISWTVSVRNILSEQFTFEAAYGRGVRSASMTERYINHFNVGQDPYEYIGNPDLKPEVNNQFEISFKGRTKKTANNSQFSYDASFFYSYFDNLIVAQIDESLMRKYNPMMEPRHPKVFGNINKAYKNGFEIGARVDFNKHFYLRSEIAYVYTKNEDLDESIPLTPPFNGKFIFGYESDRIWANMQVNMVGRQHNIAKSFGETRTGEYETLDLKIGGLLFNKFTVGLAAINIFDRAYHNHLNFSYKNQDEFNGEPIMEPGRNITAFLQYKF